MNGKIIGSDERLKYAVVDSDGRLEMICPECSKEYSEHFMFVSEFKKALDFLRIGKKKFAPHTTNSDVDEFLKVQQVIPEVEYNHIANAIIIDKEVTQERLPGVTVISAGTGDLAVAEEAAITAELMGNEV